MLFVEDRSGLSPRTILIDPVLLDVDEETKLCIYTMRW